MFAVQSLSSEHVAPDAMNTHFCLVRCKNIFWLIRHDMRYSDLVILSFCRYLFLFQALPFRSMFASVEYGERFDL